MVFFISPRYPELELPLQKNGTYWKNIKFDNHYFCTSNDEEIDALRKIIEHKKKTGKELSFQETKNTKVDEHSPMKILFHREGGLGDILFTLPIAEYLHSIGHTVDYYCHFMFWDVFKNNPNIRNIYVNIELNNWRKKGYPPPMTKELYGTYDRPLTFRGCIEKNKYAEETHAVDACYHWAGIDPEGKPKLPKLYLSNEERAVVKERLLKERKINPYKRTIALAPHSSGARNRSWQYWKEFADEASEDYNIIMINRGERFSPSSEPWTVREMCAVIDFCDIMVCCDTGPLHVAGALNKPIVTLFGPFNPDFRVKYYNNVTVLCKTSEFCEFCFSHMDKCKYLNQSRVYPPCMNHAPLDVLQAVEEALCSERVCC